MLDTGNPRYFDSDFGNPAGTRLNPSISSEKAMSSVPVSSCGIPKAPDVRDTRCSKPALHSQGFSRSSESLFPLDDIGGDLVEPGSLSDDLGRFKGQGLASYYVMSGS
jgi:hypothetical protein